jgi:hypothetical protein
MLNYLKHLFRMITPAEVAAKELALAELELLAAHSQAEHAQSVISYNQSRIKRLRLFLSKLEKQDDN